MSLLTSLRDHDHLVISGCGTRSMFLIGLFEYLTNQPTWEAVFEKLKGAAGVSSGCLVALTLLVGADLSQLTDALVELGKKYDSIAPSLSVPLVMESFGLDDGAHLQITVDTFLQVVGLSMSTTFQSLYRLTGKDFRVCAVNVHNMKPCFFSRLTTPQMPLRDAIYMSMTVPFVFKPRRWMGELYVDGGMLDNYPTNVFEGVVPLVIYMSWAVRSTPTSLRSFACAIASGSLHVQLERLAQWKLEHPGSVHAFHDDRGEQESISLTSDPESLLAMRKRGYVRGLMCQRDDVVKLLSLLTLATTRAQRIAQEAQVSEDAACQSHARDTLTTAVPDGVET